MDPSPNPSCSVRRMQTLAFSNEKRGPEGKSGLQREVSRHHCHLAHDGGSALCRNEWRAVPEARPPPRRGDAASLQREPRGVPHWLTEKNGHRPPGSRVRDARAQRRRALASQAPGQRNTSCSNCDSVRRERPDCRTTWTQRGFRRNPANHGLRPTDDLFPPARAQRHPASRVGPCSPPRWRAQDGRTQDVPPRRSCHRPEHH